MKKVILISLILCAFLSCTSVFGAEITVNESFDDMDTSLSKYGLKLSGGTASITEINDVGKKARVLTINDTDPEGSTALQANFKKLKGVAAVEIKFKIANGLNNVSVSIGEGLTTLSRVDISSQGQVSVTHGGEKKIYKSTTKENDWITLRFCHNPETGKTDVRFNSEIYKNLIPYSDYSMDGIDYILVKTNNGCPTILVDYYLAEQGYGLDAEVRPIEPPYIEDPVSHAIGGKINICYNGKYKYFDYEPKNINGRILLPFRRVFEMFGMEVSYNADEKSAVGKNDKYEIKIKSGSNIATVNGVNHTLDVTPMIIEDSFYIPVRFISQSAGKDVDWDDSTKTVIIND